MLRAHTTLVISHEGHDEGVDQGVEPLLEVGVAVAGETHVQVQVAVADVPVADSCD